MKKSVIPNANKTVFQQRLISLRKQKGFSQDKLAEKLNVGRDTVIAWENGNIDKITKVRKEVLPDFNNLIALSDTLDISVDYLMGRSDFTKDGNQYIHDSIGLSDKAINQLRKYKKADDSNYQIVIDSLKKNKPAPQISMIFLHLPIINFLLSSISFKKFLERFFNYAIDWYQVPILKDGEQFKVFPSYENDTSDYLYFGCNPGNPADNISMEIDSDFRKTISKNLLELSLDDLAQEYKKQSKSEKTF